MTDEPLEVPPDGRLRLDAEAESSDLLDLLIVGGGPAGTGAAFRARELGLSALVIELDDVLKRIRDYDKDKPIKPDFGAGKQMGFPKGGELIEQLHFFTDVRPRDLCDAWKALYRRHGVPVRTGVELVGLEPGGDRVWRALVRNHRTGQNGVLSAGHVVLALGAGMPRWLDVPGRRSSDQSSVFDREPLRRRLRLRHWRRRVGGRSGHRDIGCEGRRRRRHRRVLVAPRTRDAESAARTGGADGAGGLGQPQRAIPGRQ